MSSNAVAPCSPEATSASTWDRLKPTVGYVTCKFEEGLGLSGVQVGDILSIVPGLVMTECWCWRWPKQSTWYECYLTSKPLGVAERRHD